MGSVHPTTRAYLHTDDGARDSDGEAEKRSVTGDCHAGICEGPEARLLLAIRPLCLMADTPPVLLLRPGLSFPRVKASRVLHARREQAIDPLIKLFGDYDPDIRLQVLHTVHELTVRPELARIIAE